MADFGISEIGAAGASAAEGATAATATTAAAGSAAGAGVGATLGSIAANFGISFVLANLFAPNAKSPPSAQAFLANSFTATDPIPVPYGYRRLGGTRAELQVVSTGGNTNDTLLLLMIWGEGPVEHIGVVYADGEAMVLDSGVLASAKYDGAVLCTHHLGEDDQVADVNLIGAIANSAIWNSSCKLSGIAYTYLALGWGPSRFPTGRPTITANVTGRTLYDPRDASTAYSNNPALVIRDYLTNTRYGRGVPESMIDDDAFGDAADHCDELVAVPNFMLATLAIDAGGADYVAGDTVTLAGGTFHNPGVITVDTVNGSGAITGFTISTTGSYTDEDTVSFTEASTSGDGSGATFDTATYTQQMQARYACDGVVNVDQTPLENLKALLTSCRGFLVFSGGQYKLKIDKAETPVSFILNEDTIIGSWQIQLASKRNRFNRVKARFFNAVQSWQQDIAVQEDATYRAADGGIVLEQVLELPFTTSIYRAQQICQLELKRSRFNLTVSVVATIAATALEVGDVCYVAHATPGWPAAGDPSDGKLFRVVEMELLSSDEVRLTLLEYSDDIYDLDALDIVEPPELTSLPDARDTPAPGTPAIEEVIYETTGSAGVKTRADVTWGEADSVWVVNGGYYELEYKLSDDADWIRISPITTTADSVEDLAPGVYDFRVRAVNVAGVVSDYSDTTTKEMFGLTVAPSDVSGFYVTNHEARARCHLDLSPDLDVRQGGRVWIRWTPVTVGATWNDGTPLKVEGYPGDSIVCEGALYAGTYLAKFEDSTGHLSATAASFVVTQTLLDTWAGVDTLTFDPDFTGTFDNTVATDGYLFLAGSTLWDSMAGSIDDWGYVDAAGGYEATGTWTSDQTQDLGAVQSVRLFPEIRTLGYDSGDLWDLRLTLMDDWGTIDGDVIEDAEITPQVRVSDDAVTWGPWHNLEPADYTTRYLQYRTLHTSGSTTHNRRLINFSVTASTLVT